MLILMIMYTLLMPIVCRLLRFSQLETVMQPGQAFLRRLKVDSAFAVNDLLHAQSETPSYIHQFLFGVENDLTQNLVQLFFKFGTLTLGNHQITLHVYCVNKSAGRFEEFKICGSCVLGVYLVKFTHRDDIWNVLQQFLVAKDLVQVVQLALHALFPLNWHALVPIEHLTDLTMQLCCILVLHKRVFVHKLAHLLLCLLLLFSQSLYAFLVLVNQFGDLLPLLRIINLVHVFVQAHLPGFLFRLIGAISLISHLLLRSFVHWSILSSLCVLLSYCFFVKFSSLCYVDIWVYSQGILLFIIKVVYLYL